MDAVRYKVEGSDQTLLFLPEVVDHFRSHQQACPTDPEAGGQLFATFCGDEVRVERATGPKPTDKRSRFGFVPNRRAERREIRRMFRDGLHYVGDWHTHPQDVPSPSHVDLTNIHDTFRKSRHGLAGFLLVIAGNAGLPGCLFVGVSDGQYMCRLQLVRTAGDLDSSSG